MTDDAATTATSAPAPDAEPLAPRCPWCSEVLPAEAVERCPHCNAHLVSGTDARLPGLTEVEAPSAVKARRAEPVKRSRLLSWISGEVEDLPPPLPGGGPVPPDALAPPPRDVRREMLRLRLEAEGLTVASDGTIAFPVAATDAPDVAVPDAPDAPAGDVATPDPAAVTSAATDPAEVRKAS